MAKVANNEAAVSRWRTETFARLNEPLKAVLGDKTADALAKLGLLSVLDLMTHLPYRYLAGTETTDLSTVRPGSDVAVVARVLSVKVRGEDPSRMRLEAVLSDDHKTLNATFFGRQRLIEYWQKQLSMGLKGIFVGKVGVFKKELQMVHPDFVMLDSQGRIVARATATRKAMAEQVSRSGLIGIYPASAKFPTWQIAECAGLVLEQLAGLTDPLPSSFRERAEVIGLQEALTALHRPEVDAPIDRAVDRLKLDEALALQVTMARRRKAAASCAANPIVARDDGILADFDSSLPFKLTDGQVEVSEEIFADLAKPAPMQRLLQGEVGSGKTVVALRAMLAAVDAAQQAVLLAPTEILAAQHYANIKSLLGPLGQRGLLGAPDHATEIVLLTGSMSAASRRSAIADLASGAAGIVIGTHALLGVTVSFANLGLVVVDEQHRFGVEQRARLQGRSDTHPHMLVMSATPIPRSVAMSVFGDLEMSALVQLPAGRPQVQTTVVATREHPHWVDRVWERVREEANQGRKSFVVCPRINASETDVCPDDDPGWLPSATVESLSAKLADGPLSGLKVGVLHGRMSASDKDDAMALFASGGLDVLVATTVIEVGIDVPEASVMVIMDADRFGISQLHQLRGRIGRGQHPGICLLVTNVQLDSDSLTRLRAVESTRDGFELANLDLIARREGNVVGVEQSGGRSTLRLLRVIDDAELIKLARDLADEWVNQPGADDDPVLADLVTQTEFSAQSDWLECN